MRRFMNKDWAIWTGQWPWGIQIAGGGGWQLQVKSWKGSVVVGVSLHCALMIWRSLVNNLVISILFIKKFYARTLNRLSLESLEDLLYIVTEVYYFKVHTTRTKLVHYLNLYENFEYLYIFNFINRLQILVIYPSASTQWALRGNLPLFPHPSRYCQ